MGTVFKNIWKWVVDFGTFASILGIILIFTRSDIAIIIALCFVCVMLLVIMGYVLYVLHTFIKQSNSSEHSTIASFAEFKSDNGVTSTYDTRRLIQSKRAVLSEIVYYPPLPHFLRFFHTKIEIVRKMTQEKRKDFNPPQSLPLSSGI